MPDSARCQTLSGPGGVRQFDSGFVESGGTTGIVHDDVEFSQGAVGV